MRRYRLLEHTADTGLVAYGHDLREAFANAAYGMFTIIAGRRGVRARVKREIAVSAPDREALLVAWLNALLYHVDAEELLFCRFQVTELTETALTAEAWGETIDPGRHRLRTAIKSATYHMIEVAEGEPCRVRVILDL
ncbi:MAG: archease [Chloroflexi bacterium]|nr:archease [Chloroflexota bacterium]